MGAIGGNEVMIAITKVMEVMAKVLGGCGGGCTEGVLRGCDRGCAESGRGCAGGAGRLCRRCLEIVLKVLGGCAEGGRGCSEGSFRSSSLFRQTVRGDFHQIQLAREVFALKPDASSLMHQTQQCLG